MFTFNRVGRIERDKNNNYYVWVVFVDGADMEERSESLFLDHLPTIPERTALIVSLRNQLNSGKYPPAKPVWDATDLTPAMKNFLINHGVYKLKINDREEVIIDPTVAP